MTTATTTCRFQTRYNLDQARDLVAKHGFKVVFSDADYAGRVGILQNWEDDGTEIVEFRKAAGKFYGDLIAVGRR